MDFFQMLFEFLAQEDELNTIETQEMIAHYLSPPQKEGVMTTYQTWVNKGKVEGLKEGLQEKARLSVLRGRWNKSLSADDLADLADLPLTEVNNLIKGYDKAYGLWTKNNGRAFNELPEIEYLSKQEVVYLMRFFTQKHQVATEN